MSGECDRCGLEGLDCQCLLNEIVDRVNRLEEKLDKLTDVVKAISDHIRSQNEWGM